MKKADLKRDITAGKTTVGSWITIDNEIIAEIMAGMGFDWLTVDMEHSGIDFNMAQKLVRVIELSGIAPLIRVSENNPDLIKRAMDTGAHGVIVPMVKTAADARRAVESVYYPPKGKRGVGLSRAQGYGLEFNEYRRWLGKKGVVVAIIEHIDAINNLEEILSVEGIDATMIGPYDLSGSMGFPGEFERPDVKAAINKYMKVCKSMKKSAGLHLVEPEGALLNQKIKAGFRFIAFGVDHLFFARNIEKQLKQVKYHG